MIKMISRRTGGPTDTSRDYDFTDWSAVAEFARQFGGLLPGDRDGLVAGTPAAVGTRSPI
jgi:menaquinone-dependent protoporphyrinogen oxidase